MAQHPEDIELGIWFHYKDPEGLKPYTILGNGTNRTTGEREVAYLALYDSDEKLHLRHVNEWRQTVEVDGKIVPRFRKA